MSRGGRFLGLAVLSISLAAMFCPFALASQDPSSPGETAEAPPDAGYVSSGPSKCVEIGNFYLRRKKYKGALSRFREAVRADADYAPAYLGLGRVYEKLGMDSQALSAYRQYLDLLPSDKDAEDAREVHRAIERLRKRAAGSG